MTNKTIFCVSTANSDLFKDNFRNSFSNHLPQFSDKSFNYKMSLGSIHLEKSFRTIGRNETFFLLIHLNYSHLESKYQDESDYKDYFQTTFSPNTIHEHFLNKFSINRQDTQNHDDQPSSLVKWIHMMEIVIVLRPGRYRNTLELVDTINNDLTQLGVNKYILFKQTKVEEENKLILSINNTISRCIISSKLMKILGFNIHKSQRTIFQMGEISLSDLKKIAFYSFNKFPKKSIKTIGLDLMTGKDYESSKELRQNTYLPSLIKLYCFQLDESIESSNFTRLLAVCPGIGKNDSNIYEYQPLTEHFSGIAVSDLEKLSFEIRDEKDSLLELDVGAATYIRLKINQNNDDINMDTINIFSNDKKSKQLYPGNTNTNFTIQLPTTLSQGSAKRWTIKLTSLSMPPADISITKDFGFFKVKVYDQIEGLSNPYENDGALCSSCTKLYTEARHDPLLCDEIVATCKQEKHIKSFPEHLECEYQITIPPKDYKTLSDFQHVLGWALLDEALIQWPSTYDTGILPAGIDFQEKGDKRHLSLYNNFATKEVSFGFPIILAYIMGIKNNVQGINNEFNVSNLTPTWFSNDFSNEYVWVHVKPSSSVNFPYLPDLNAGKARHAKIQCSEVKSTIFAGKHENLLAFYSLQSGSMSGDVFFYEFTHPLEVELNSQHIDSLNFKITPENNDNDISFASKKTPVFMSLIITKYD